MSSAGNPRVKLVKSSGEEQIFVMDKSRFTLGRSGDSDIQANDASVSRHHAEIVQEGSIYRILDKQSKCGTFVNGKRIQESALSHMDRVQLGNDTVLVFMTESEGAQASNAPQFSPTDTSSVILSLAGSDLSNVSKLLELARAFTGAAPLHEVLDIVLDTAIEVTGADRAFLVMKEQAGEPRMERGRNRLKQPLGDEYFQISQTALNQVLETGEKILMSDVRGTDGYAQAESVMSLELRSIVCLPLKAFGVGLVAATGRQKVIGALYMDGKRVAESFSNISQGILDTLAGDATAVIENARLLKESREKEKLETELATANEIQRSLFPTINGSYGFMDACAENIPSRHISGDCYDLLKLPDGRIGSVIADVSGKGISAALLCSMVQGVLYAEAMKQTSAAECIDTVNRYLVQRTGGNKFVTLFYSILAPSGEFRFVNAGHNPPLLIHPEGSIEELHSGGVIVGVFDFATYTESTIQLHPGDLVCLFTDGVTEARNAQGEMLGDEELKRLLIDNRSRPVPEIVDKVFQAVQEFSAGMPQSDDISVYILRYTAGV